MIVESILVSIATPLAKSLMERVSDKIVDAVSNTSRIEGLKFAIFGDLSSLQKELSKLQAVLHSVDRIDPLQCDKNHLVLRWLKLVSNATIFADNLIDELTYDRTRRQLKHKMLRSGKLVVATKLVSWDSMQINIARKVSEFMSMTSEIYKEAEQTLMLTKLVRKDSSYLHQTSDLSAHIRGLRENPDTSVVIGRRDDEELIVSKLCSPNNGHDLPVIVIVGRSGAGKTTLARKVYDSEIVRENFGKRTWISVSDNFKLERFLDEMLQSVTGRRQNLDNNGAMEEKLQQHLQKEKRGYLLVLDDVWNTDDQRWKSVESSLVRVMRSTRSRLLVTTQSSKVASVMRATLVHELKDLGDNDAWRLFAEIAMANKSPEQVSNLEGIGRRILSKCDGLPLAITTLGSLLGSMNTESEWQSVEGSKIWQLDQSNIMPWLLLSFDHLPDPKMKQCFIHCSIAIKKGTYLLQSRLIQAWMAQGFIQATDESHRSMEAIGEAYVTALVANRLLQMDNHRDGCYLWMHDLVHELANFIYKDTCLISEGAFDHLHNASEVEHLRICGGNTGDLLQGNNTLTNLRTLICNRATLSTDSLTQSTLLRDLQLIDCCLEEVPAFVGSLKHLRYLSVRKNPITHLPESIGTLFNLQTIDLEECDHLVELPETFTLLVNLRHILTTKPVQMPKGMGELACLRTLPGIALEEKKGLEIQELKSLQLLSGKIEIRGLEHIRCKEDAMKASLKTKAGIEDLTLWWRNEQQKASMVSSHDQEIMEGLHPHSNLIRISVCNFGGTGFSSWLPNMNNLKAVHLVSCYQCVQLPALGQLGSLEEIRIHKMESLEIIGIDFYHKNDRKAYDRSKRILFPRLKSLRLRDMPKLRDWFQPSGSTYVVFPCLKELEISNCPLLVTAPTLQGVGSLENLHVMCCDSLTSFPKIHGLSSLRTLRITQCKSLSILQGLESCVSIETLVLLNTKLPSIPDLTDLIHLKLLIVTHFSRQMWIPGCLSHLINLRYLEIGAFSEEIKDLDGFRHIPKGLKRLSLYKWPKAISLPRELQFFNQLESLCIEEFGEIVSLPNWLGNLSSLKELSIHGCRKLKYLPQFCAMQNLAQLGKLKISGCPFLSERCNSDDGKEWHKIEHISYVKIDEQIIERPT